MDVSLPTVQRWEKQGAKPIRFARRELARLFQEVGINVDNSQTVPDSNNST